MGRFTLPVLAASAALVLAASGPGARASLERPDLGPKEPLEEAQAPPLSVVPDGFLRFDLARRDDPLRWTDRVLVSAALIPTLAPAAALTPGRRLHSMLVRLSLSAGARVARLKARLERRAWAEPAPRALEQLEETAPGSLLSAIFFDGKRFPPGYTARRIDNVVALRDPEGGEKFFEIRAHLATSDQEDPSPTASKPSEPVEMSALHRAVAGIVHDLRSPLTVMLGYIDVLDRNADALDPAGIRDGLQGARQAGHRQRTLIAHLLDASRLDAGALRIDPSRVDAQALLQSVISENQGAASAKDVRLVFDSPQDEESVPRVWADELQIGRVLYNLLHNAFKFTPQKMVIRAGLAARVLNGDSFVEFLVANDGKHIAQDDLERIFQPFVQTAEGAQQAHSTGLGLTVSRGLVELHGGKIWAENRPEGGVAFKFTLPAAKD